MKAMTGKGFEPDICRIKVRKIINCGQLDSEMYVSATENDMHVT